MMAVRLYHRHRQYGGSKLDKIVASDSHAQWAFFVHAHKQMVSDCCPSSQITAKRGISETTSFTLSWTTDTNFSDHIHKTTFSQQDRTTTDQHP